MRPKHVENGAESEAIALKMLGFIANDESRLAAFLNLTGTPPSQLPALALDSQFLAGVFDFVLADQSLLLLFAESEALEPESVAGARRLLPGASDA